jgi:hypothetical protein
MLLSIFLVEVFYSLMWFPHSTSINDQMLFFWISLSCSDLSWPLKLFLLFQNNRTEFLLMPCNLWSSVAHLVCYRLTIWVGVVVFVHEWQTCDCDSKHKLQHIHSVAAWVLHAACQLAAAAFTWQQYHISAAFVVLIGEAKQNKPKYS